MNHLHCLIDVILVWKMSSTTPAFPSSSFIFFHCALQPQKLYGLLGMGQFSLSLSANLPILYLLHLVSSFTTERFSCGFTFSSPEMYLCSKVIWLVSSTLHYNQDVREPRNWWTFLWKSRKKKRRLPYHSQIYFLQQDIKYASLRMYILTLHGDVQWYYQVSRNK